MFQDKNNIGGNRDIYKQEESDFANQAQFNIGERSPFLNIFGNPFKEVYDEKVNNEDRPSWKNLVH